jgi:hypothetical protein
MVTRSSLALALCLVAGCGWEYRGQSDPPNGNTAGQGGGAGRGGSGGAADSVQLDPGEEVEVGVPESAGLDALATELDGVANLDGSTLVGRRTPAFAPAVDYDPLASARLDQIQTSPLALAQQDLDTLARLGFVITTAREYPTFVNGYVEIYGEHLPLYISADSILNAVHRSYDSILETIEIKALVPALQTMLTGMRARLAAGAATSFGVTAVEDADLYLAVALGLLEGAPVGPVANGSSSAIDEIYGLATAAHGLKEAFELFGAERDIDFSQYTPRGHYANDESLERYFRAMTWLGLGDLHLVETVVQDGKMVHVFRRRQLELAYALAALYDGESRAAWQSIDDTVRAFVGEADAMTLPELDLLLADLGLSAASELSNVPDATIAQTVLDRRYGEQKIAGHVLAGGSVTVPLASTFLLLGKRYVVDSHVFSNVVYDRVSEERAGRRMMPNPLDVAYAALQNDGALPLLLPELEEHNYAPELERTRLLVDAHSEDFWSKNLYNDWLSALRALSPLANVGDPKASGMPLVTGTEAWNRRILNTQLASWAELRHDTVLYAKQSYSGIPACDFPDAYVDPYPEAFARLARFAEHGIALAERLPGLQGDGFGMKVAVYFEHLRATSARLRDLAEKQRSGTEYSAEDLAFINQIVADGDGCVFDPGGWYPQLVWDYDTQHDTEYDPTIADVHTQPADQVGNIVGRVLHVGTGPVRAMVVTVDTCSGPRAYVGLASSYFEYVTTDFQRLTDKEWVSHLSTNGGPPETPWLGAVGVR